VGDVEVVPGRHVGVHGWSSARARWSGSAGLTRGSFVAGFVALAGGAATPFIGGAVEQLLDDTRQVAGRTFVATAVSAAARLYKPPIHPEAESDEHSAGRDAGVGADGSGVARLRASCGGYEGSRDALLRLADGAVHNTATTIAKTATTAIQCFRLRRGRMSDVRWNHRREARPHPSIAALGRCADSTEGGTAT
jgi:hypothetical protein